MSVRFCTTLTILSLGFNTKGTRKMEDQKNPIEANEQKVITDVLPEEERQRKMASIVQIDSISPIEGADRIVVATMKGLGWKVVVQKGEFEVGDRATYFEIDSLLKKDDERYAFLLDRCLRKFVSKSGQVLYEGIRIKTIKLKGIFSQGLLIPLDKFPEITDTLAATTDGKTVFTNVVREKTQDENGNDIYVDKEVQEELLGANVTYLLKVEHYDDVKERFAPVCNCCHVAADAYGPFPIQIPKTDEARIQSNTDLFEELKDRHFEVTVKADGSSTTVFYAPSIDAENPLGVCSRNIRQKPEMKDGTVPMFWQVANKYKVGEALQKHYEETGTEWAVQAEMVGPGIQGARNRETEHTMKVFRIWDITNQCYVKPDVRRAFCKANNIPHVEVQSEDMQVFHEFTDVDSLLKFAEGKTAEGYEREGLVFKTCDDGPQRSFKAVSNRYLMKIED